MEEINIEQALFIRQGEEGQWLAQSPGFTEEWLREGEALCRAFGERLPGMACPPCVFARPFLKRWVAVVQAADQVHPGATSVGPLGFYLLVLPQNGYRSLAGDPFFLSERFPPPWRERGPMPPLSWAVEPPARRSVADVQKILQRPDGPTLLGGVQALVDGGHLVFERPAPDPSLLRSLWNLLPFNTRCDLWPATFAFGNQLKFDALVVPRADEESLAQYVTEQQAEYYPEGRYELYLQIAAENGDQRELDALFARRSRAQTWRMGLFLLGMVMTLAVGSKLLMPVGRPPAPPAKASAPHQTAPGPVEKAP